MTLAANLGQNWNNGSESGSRGTNSNNPWNSNTNNGGRGRCDDFFPRSTLTITWRCRPITVFQGGQLDCPASANTLQDSVERRVPMSEMRSRYFYYG